MLLLNREEAVKEGLTTSGERFMMKTASQVCKRRVTDMAGSTAKKSRIEVFFSRKPGGVRVVICQSWPKSHSASFGKKNTICISKLRI